MENSGTANYNNPVMIPNFRDEITRKWGLEYHGGSKKTDKRTRFPTLLPDKDTTNTPCGRVI